MLLRDGVTSEDLMSLSSGTNSPASSSNQPGRSSTCVSSDDRLHCTTTTTTTIIKMEDRTRSADGRRTLLGNHGNNVVSSSTSSASDKKITLGITRAMSAQERSSLSLKHQVDQEAARLSEEKSKSVKGSDDHKWRESIRQQMEAELDQRVRDALETPPPEKSYNQQNNDSLKKNNSSQDLENLNAHVLLDLSDKERAYLKSRRWKALQAKRQMQKFMTMNYGQSQNSSRIEVVFRDELSKSNQDEFPGVYGLNSFSEGVKDLHEIHNKQYDKYPTIRQLHKQYYTKEGYLTASRNGRFPDGTSIPKESDGSYEDRFGVIRNQHGPFWPNDWGPLFPAPKFLWKTDFRLEPLYYFFKNQNYSTVENQLTPYMSKWRGVLIVFDSERSSRDHFASPVPQGCCPSLLFESRFECGNLRQARRVGQFEYELVLKTDLYTNRHTQWYYFRVQNTVPGVTYRFRIVNLLKRDSLYNYGMRPLVYSESDAKNKGIGWVRTGHHISYSRNVIHLHCPLMMRGIPFYELEWQMEFPNENDTYYLAHCYPYTFTDLKDDLEFLLNDTDRQKYIQREVLCETRAGNSCFLVTVTNFDQPEEVQAEKKAVVVTARVHPGESQASWMMKGVLDYVTGPSVEAKQLRDKFIFKMVPMLNPDGVIVGNYRCSLAARDLNRNYRHPKRESFPTVWHTKHMIELLSEKHEILLYCDLHGHSRKHNVFMYGNNTATDDPDNNNNNTNNVVGARAFLNERLFPWLMAQKSPEKFSFPFCKFNIKRCKEATGRVVMWRQMRIHNSFTLEATFSGTAMNKNLAAEECRHFNISDYMEMGHILCQSALEFKAIQENKARQTEIVLEMTKYLTCQVLERRRGITYKMPNLKAFMKQEQATRNEEEKENQESSQDVPMEQDTINGHHGDDDLSEIPLLTRESPIIDDKPGKKYKDKKTDSKHNNTLSKLDVDNLLDAESMKTMDGCLQILAQLHVSEALEESDSSDSDSESEPELKPPPEPKVKKKKRKSKKQRDKEQQERKGGSGGSDKKEERKHSALPTISGNQGKESRNEDSSKSSQMLRGEKYSGGSKRDPHFVSKYEGRKNGGIPCFAEERSVERAARQRMAEMKKRTEEEKQREMAFFMREFLDSDKPTSSPSLSTHIQMPHVEVKVALNEGTSNIAQTLVGLNVRTGYTHADSFRDLAPAVLPATAPQNNSMPKIESKRLYTQVYDTHNLHTPLVESYLWRWPSTGNSSEMSDSETDSPTTMIPMTARATPYHHDSMISSHPTFHHHTSSSNHAHNVFKKHLSLRGPSMRSVTRHVTNSAQSPISYSHTNNLIRSEAPLGQSQTPDQRRMEERKRNPGPLPFDLYKRFKIRGLKVPGHGE